MSPYFLGLNEVVRLHADLIQQYGGAEGIRDVGLLQSAVDSPRATFSGEFLNVDLFEMAAAYLFHIVRNHPFIDGNKRTEAAAAIIFLAMNDTTIESDETGLVTVTVRVAEGKATKDEIARFFRDRSIASN